MGEELRRGAARTWGPGGRGSRCGWPATAPNLCPARPVLRPHCASETPVCRGCGHLRGLVGAAQSHRQAGLVPRKTDVNLAGLASGRKKAGRRPELWAGEGAVVSPG